MNDKNFKMNDKNFKINNINLKIIEDKIKTFQDIIQNTIISAQKYKILDILTANEINICIQNLEILFTNLTILSNKISGFISENITPNIDDILNNLQDVNNELSSIIKNYGTNNLSDLLLICLGPDFINKNLNNALYKDKFFLLTKYVHPINYKVISWKNSENKKSNKETILQKNKIIEDCAIVEHANTFDCFDLARTKRNFQSRVYGIKIAIQDKNQKQTLIISGVVDDILLDCLNNSFISTTLKEIEETLLKEEYKNRKKLENKKNNRQSEIDKFMNTPIYVKKNELFINPHEDGWQYRYYKVLFDIEIDEERKKQICINYLSILEWNYYYYKSKCIDWRFKYNYNYPPLFQDLIKYIPYFETRFLTDKKYNPITEKVQLAYVLPRDSLNLIPKININLLTTKLNEYYKIDYDFEWAFCRYFWECHVKIPDLDLELLENILL